MDLSLSVNTVNNDSQLVMESLPSNTFDACISDPPYGVNIAGAQWDRALPSEAFWKPLYRILKPGGHAAIFTHSTMMHRLACILEDSGFELRDTVLWVYAHSLVLSKNALRNSYEPILIVRKPCVGSAENNRRLYGVGDMNTTAPGVAIPSEYRQRFVKIDELASSPVHSPGRKSAPSGFTTQGRHPTNLVLDERIANELSNKIQKDVTRLFVVPKASRKDKEGTANHPTVKPLELMRWLTRLLTRENDLVIDPFMGSGTTGVACVELDRRFVGIELEEQYFNAATERIQRANLAPKPDALVDSVITVDEPEQGDSLC